MIEKFLIHVCVVKLFDETCFCFPLTHVCVAKLFDEAFFCFPLTGNNLITLIFLFDCLDMKLNVFEKWF